MQSAGDAIKKIFDFEEAGERECEQCGSVYKLYKTPRGTMGACKPCEDKKLKKSMNLPTADEYKDKKKTNFIMSFEQVTSDLINATVNSYRPTHETQAKAKEAAIEFVKDFDVTRSFALSGSPGLGKSHLAYAVTKGVRGQGFKALYIKSTDLLRHIKNTYKDHSGITEDQIFNMIDELDLLTLDDIGSEYVKANEYGHESWASDVLYKVIDSRLDKSIVCTTNYSESELTQKYGNNGPRITDRMMDMATAIRLEGESYRRKERF